MHVGKLASLHYLPPAECSLTGRSPELAAQAGCTVVCDGGCNARSCVAVAVRLAKVILSIIPSWYPPEPVVQNISWSQAHCFGGEWCRTVVTSRHRTLGLPNFSLRYRCRPVCFTLALWYLPRGLTSMRIAAASTTRATWPLHACTDGSRSRRCYLAEVGAVPSTCVLAPCVNYVRLTTVKFHIHSYKAQYYLHHHTQLHLYLRYCNSGN